MGDTGQVLLTGPSGEGKTTILMAIAFALYGHGRKVVTQGKTSCQVTLEFEDMKIVRTKSPNRLLLNDVIEDAAAQDMINRKFGTTLTSQVYVEQSGLKSFILMSPSDKLEFLEKHAFHGTNLSEIKKRNRILIAKCKEELTIAATELRMTEQSLSEMSLPEKVEFPLQSRGSRERAIANEETRKKNCGVRVKKAERKKANLERELHDIQLLTTRIAGIEQNHQYISQKASEVEDQIEDAERNFDGPESLRATELHLERIVARRELTTMEAHHEENLLKLEQMRVDERNALVLEVELAEQELWRDHKIDEIDMDISDLETCMADLEKIGALQRSCDRNQVDNAEHEADKETLVESEAALSETKVKRDRAKLKSHLYSCPSCEARLRVDGNALVVAGEDPEEDLDIDELDRRVSKLSSIVRTLQGVIAVNEQKMSQYRDDMEMIDSLTASYDEVPKLSEVREDLAYLQNYKKRQKELESEISCGKDKLRRGIYSASLTSFESSVSSAAARIKENDRAGRGAIWGNG